MCPQHFPAAESLLLSTHPCLPRSSIAFVTRSSVTQALLCSRITVTFDSSLHAFEIVSLQPSFAFDLFSIPRCLFACLLKTLLLPDILLCLLLGLRPQSPSLVCLGLFALSITFSFAFYLAFAVAFFFASLLMFVVAFFFAHDPLLRLLLCLLLCLILRLPLRPILRLLLGFRRGLLCCL